MKNNNFYKKIYKKKQILLTHSISLLSNNFPYSIDYDGKVTKHYDPKYWSEYLKHPIDKHIIPILLLNEGWLYTDSKTGKKIIWTGKIYPRGENEVIYHEWRNNFHYASYPLLQIESTIKLCKELCEKFKIPRKCIGHNSKVDGIEKFNGITTRSNYLSEYYDLSPAFPFIFLKKQIEKK